MVIWKYPLELAEKQTLQTPLGAQILSLQVQRGVPTLWILVDPDSPKVSRTLWMVGTGYPVPAAAASGTFIGTYQVEDGALVFHIFEAT